MSELERRASLNELIRWRLFDAEWPLPDVLSDIHNAMRCAIAVNSVRSADTPAVDTNEFRVLRERVKPKDEPEVIEAHRFRAQFGG